MSDVYGSSDFIGFVQFRAAHDAPELKLFIDVIDVGARWLQNLKALP
jgi:hypothetical protein